MLTGNYKIVQQAKPCTCHSIYSNNLRSYIYIYICLQYLSIKYMQKANIACATVRSSTALHKQSHVEEEGFHKNMMFEKIQTR